MNFILKPQFIALFTAALSLGSLVEPVRADIFGVGDNAFTIDFTSIGNAGNNSDTTGYGSVGYDYRISTYEISQNQINSAVASGLAHVTAGAWSGDKPAANMSWYESAAFVNWLNTSKGFQSAYKLSWNGSRWSMALWNASDAGYDANNLYRNSLAQYFLPSENEFYKAAFGKSDGSGYYLYPTASNTAPTAVTSGTAAGTAVYNQGWIPPGPASVYEAGGLSSYGTMGQGGNIQEWQETSSGIANTDVNANRMVRGGYWFGGSSDALDSSTRSSFFPDADYVQLGFRVASASAVDPVPEPSQVAASVLLIAGIAGFVMVRRKKAALAA
jgi:formylglycine-generating enzyme required for sulfatase activity